MMLKSDVNPLMDVILNKVRSTWIQVQMVTSSVLTLEYRMSQVALDIINIVQGTVSCEICFEIPLFNMFMYHARIYTST